MSNQSSSSQIPLRDVVIAGAGIAGATLALGLKRQAGDRLDVVLCDPALAAVSPPSLRAVAIAPDTRAHLDDLDVWASVAAWTQPIHRMVVTDGRPGHLPNPDLLTLASPGYCEPVAHMVLADRLRTTLLAACRQAGVRFVAAPVADMRPEASHLVLASANGDTLRTRLLVAADGGRSRLRARARIQTLGRDYPACAIVASLRHTVDHAGVAIQHFLPSGPIALLPLRDDTGTGHLTSIVWTERSDEARRLVALDPPAFVMALEDRVGLEQGFLGLADQPRATPLKLMLARRLVASRFALLGDAARVIHPLAGQGLNLGLRDAMALTREIVEAAALGLDAGSPSVLSRYERERRPDATMMAGLTDSLDRLFSNDSAVLRFVRDLGLGLVHRSPAVTRRLVRGAAGRRGG